VWLVLPAKPHSDWRVVGAMPWQREKLGG
jgi:hypothetical protein